MPILEENCKTNGDNELELVSTSKLGLKSILIVVFFLKTGKRFNKYFF